MHIYSLQKVPNQMHQFPPELPKQSHKACKDISEFFLEILKFVSERRICEVSAQYQTCILKGVKYHILNIQFHMIAIFNMKHS